jgi:hypothetical protein
LRISLFLRRVCAYCFDSNNVQIPALYASYAYFSAELTRTIGFQYCTVVAEIIASKLQRWCRNRYFYFGRSRSIASLVCYHQPYDGQYPRCRSYLANRHGADRNSKLVCHAWHTQPHSATSCLPRPVKEAQSDRNSCTTPQ